MNEASENSQVPADPSADGEVQQQLNRDWRAWPRSAGPPSNLQLRATTSDCCVKLPGLAVVCSTTNIIWYKSNISSELFPTSPVAHRTSPLGCPQDNQSKLTSAYVLPLTHSLLLSCLSQQTIWHLLRTLGSTLTSQSLPPTSNVSPRTVISIFQITLLPLHLSPPPLMFS